MSKRRGRSTPPRNKRTGKFMKAGATRHKRRSVRVHTGSFGRKTRRVRVSKHPVLVNRRRRHYSANPRRRQRYAYVTNRRRRYGRNPGGGGLMAIFSKPTLKQVGFAVVGIAGTPMLSGFINRYLPASLVGNKYAGYAVKGLSAYGLSLVAKKVAGPEAGRAVLVGGLAAVAISVVSDLFPTLFSLGTGTGTGRYLTAQPLLAGAGMYPSRALSGPITSGAPGRLDPASRF